MLTSQTVAGGQTDHAQVTALLKIWLICAVGKMTVWI